MAKNNISWQTNKQLTKAGRQKPGKNDKSQKTNIWLTKTGKQNPGNKEQQLANSYIINKKLANKSWQKVTKNW